jgi:branched-chain amino acid aminotransferase
MTGTVYLNGEFVPRDGARVSVDDSGFLHGAGLFETMRAAAGRVFRLDRHLDRMVRSAEALHMPIERSVLPRSEDFESLLERNELLSGRVRLTVTCGSVFGHGDTAPAPTVCATVTGQADYPADQYKTGVAVLIARQQVSPTDPLAGHKTTNYLPRLLALRAAQGNRCSEALWFTPQNLLAEASVSNVFIVRDGGVATPPVETPVLPGIARATVLELCARDGIPADERALTIDVLLDADEVFLTNSIMQVMPVVRVERRDIGSGRPGPVAGQLLAAYRDLVVKECGGDE